MVTHFLGQYLFDKNGSSGVPEHLFLIKTSRRESSNACFC